MADFFSFNAESIYLALVVALVSGVAFSIAHELTRVAIDYAKSKLKQCLDRA